MEHRHGISAATAERAASILRLQQNAIAKALSASGSSPEKNAQNDSSIISCLVCGDHRPSTACVFECGHGQLVCGPCAARVRLLSNDRKCPMCKSLCEHIIVLSRDDLLSRPADLTFNDFGIYGTHGGPDIIFDDASGMFYHKTAEAVRVEIIRLRTLRCGCNSGGGGGGGNGQNGGRGKSHIGNIQCEETFSSIDALIAHSETAHSMTICDLCAKNRAVFINELPRLSKKALTHHCNVGDPAIGFSGHPNCRFCNIRYYDDAALWTHLQRDHFYCHVCARTDAPGSRQYFATYDDLERHYAVDHFVCEETVCKKDAKFQVFESLLELSTHMAVVHGVSSDLTSQLSFRYKAPAQSRGGGGRGRNDDSNDGGGGGGRGREQDQPPPRQFVFTVSDFSSMRLLQEQQEQRGNYNDDDNDDYNRAVSIARDSHVVIHGSGADSSRDNVLSIDTFPSLPTSSSSSSSRSAPNGFARAVSSGVSGLTTGSAKSLRNEAEFPSLPTPSSSSSSSRGGGGHNNMFGGGGFGAAARAGANRISQNYAAHNTLEGLLARSGQTHLVLGAAIVGGGTASGKVPLPDHGYTVDYPIKSNTSKKKKQQQQQQQQQDVHEEADEEESTTPSHINHASVSSSSLSSSSSRTSGSASLISQAVGASSPSPSLSSSSTTTSSSGPGSGSAISMIASALDPDSFNKFKEASAKFKSSSSNNNNNVNSIAEAAKLYHSTSVRLFSETKSNSSNAKAVFLEAFPLLVCNLQDGHLKNSLLQVHNSWLKTIKDGNASNSSATVSSTTSTSSTGNAPTKKQLGGGGPTASTGAIKLKGQWAGSSSNGGGGGGGGDDSTPLAIPPPPLPSRPAPRPVFVKGAASLEGDEEELFPALSAKPISTDLASLIISYGGGESKGGKGGGKGHSKTLIQVDEDEEFSRVVLPKGDKPASSMAKSGGGGGGGGLQKSSEFSWEPESTTQSSLSSQTSISNGGKDRKKSSNNSRVALPQSVPEVADSKTSDQPVFSELLHTTIGGPRRGGANGWMSTQLSRKPAPKRSEEDLKRIVQSASVSSRGSEEDAAMTMSSSRQKGAAYGGGGGGGGGGRSNDLDEEFAAFMGVKRNK
jgi:hypothetical protein